MLYMQKGAANHSSKGSDLRPEVIFSILPGLQKVLCSIKKMCRYVNQLRSGMRILLKIKKR